MADNVGFTPGTGVTVATDDVGGAQFQRVKLTDGTPDSAEYITGNIANGLDVDVTRVQGSVTVVQATAANLKVDASGVTVPVSDSGGSLTVDDGGGSLSVDDNGGSLTVDGTINATQGTAAANTAAWPVKIADGANAANLTNVSGSYALKVDVVQDVASTAQIDKTGFTEGSGRISVNAGVVNDTIGSDPAEDQAAAIRITPKRAQHANLRNNSGAEIGVVGAPLRIDPTGTTPQPVSGTVTASLSGTTNAGATAKIVDLDTGGGTDNVAIFGIALPKSGGAVAGGTTADPIRIDPTGTTIQPVSGTITANQGGAPWALNQTQIGGAAVVTGAAGVQRVAIADEIGAAFSHANPLPVTQARTDQTFIKKTVTFSASQSDIAIFTPTGGKRFVITSLTLTPNAAGALIRIFDNTNTSDNTIYLGQPALGVHQVLFNPPLPAAAVNNVLRYSTLTSADGNLTVIGYEE